MSEAKFVLTAGSEANRDVVGNILQYADFVNSYGPTETTVVATYLRIKKNDILPDRISIGKPHTNMQVYILNGLQLC
jgi:non-ribosomal peptide synthetase component F